MKYTIPYDDKITLPHIKKIDSISISADQLFYNSKELTGEVIISGDYILDDTQDVMEFRHDIPVSFLIDDENVSPQINISNFKYELIPGRGIEIMFELDVILAEAMQEEEKIVAREDIDEKLEETTKHHEEIEETIGKNTKAKKNKKVREKAEEEDVKAFQGQIDDSLDAALDKRHPVRDKNNKVKEEIPQEPEVIAEEEVEVNIEEAILETVNVQEDDIFSTHLRPTLSSFDVGFVPKENDKMTTYKIILVEDNEDIDLLLETRNLSKASICQDYHFDNKIVLKIEND